MNLLQWWIEATAPLRERTSARLRGLFLLLLGLGLGWWQLLAPILDVRRGVAVGFFSPWLALLAIVCLGAGLFMTAFGERGESWLRLLSRDMDFSNLTARNVAILTVVALAFGAIMFWLNGYVRG